MLGAASGFATLDADLGVLAAPPDLGERSAIERRAMVVVLLVQAGEPDGLADREALLGQRSGALKNRKIVEEGGLELFSVCAARPLRGQKALPSLRVGVIELPSRERRAAQAPAHAADLVRCRLVVRLRQPPAVEAAIAGEWTSPSRAAVAVTPRGRIS